jgi:hypothetical protein
MANIVHVLVTSAALLFTTAERDAASTSQTFNASLKPAVIDVECVRGGSALSADRKQKPMLDLATRLSSMSSILTPG